MDDKISFGAEGRFSWWLNRPPEKYAQVKLDRFPNLIGVKINNI